MDIARRYTLAAGLPQNNSIGDNSSRRATAPGIVQSQDGRQRYRPIAPLKTKKSPTGHSISSLSIKEESSTPPYRNGSKPAFSTPNLNLDYFSFADSEGGKVMDSRRTSLTSEKPTWSNIFEDLDSARQQQREELQELYDWCNIDELFVQEPADLSPSAVAGGHMTASIDHSDTSSLLDAWTLTEGEDVTKDRGEGKPKHGQENEVFVDLGPVKKPESLQSFSADSLTSGEEFSSIDSTSAPAAVSSDDDGALDSFLAPSVAGGAVEKVA